MFQTSPNQTDIDVGPKRKKSFAWQNYKMTNNPNKLKCIHCNRLCSIKGGSTGNLVRHMRLRHKSMYASLMQAPNEDETHCAVNEISRNDNTTAEESVQTILEIECETSAETAKSSTNAVEESQQQSIAYYLMEHIDFNKAEEINNQILKIMVKEFYPFNLIKNEDFISFVSMLNPNYTLPTPKSLSKELLLQAYKSTVEELKSTLKEVKYVALAIDRWTSINDENYITVTAHYFNKDLALKASLLDCISFHKDSSINIAVFFQELVAIWGLSEKIIAVVTENDQTMIEAIKDCQWQHISCFAHTLNEVAKAGLADINDVITKVRNIVHYFKTTPDALEKLNVYQNEIGLSNLKFKKDTQATWNSTFDMLTRFLKSKDILANQLLDNLSIEISSEEWIVLECAVKLLVAFNTITVEICSEKFVPLSKVPYMIRFMVKHVSNIMQEQNLPEKIKKMGNTLKEELLKQYKNLEANDVICQSVLLDPRFKKRGFPESSFQIAYSSLHDKVISLKKEKSDESYCTQSATQENKKIEYFIDVWSEFREYGKPLDQNFAPDATVEIDVFLNEPYINMKDNPMTYWGNENNHSKFPTLFELLKCRLCVPATSIPSHNIFSKEGNDLVEKRKFLTSGKLKEIMFLYQNL